MSGEQSCKQAVDFVAARLSVENLIETSPGFMADAGGSGNTDSAMHDLLGRSYTLSLSLEY